MKKYSLADLALLPDIRLKDDRDGHVEISQISTDSRAVAADDLFLALRGEKFDGHDFLAQAIAGGCRALCVEESEVARLPSGFPALLCKDSLKAYQAMAEKVRDDMDSLLIGITGSVGKTSTKDILASLLSGKYRVHKTADNNNNEIGLPLTILQAPGDTQICITEMGMRGPGQIRELTLIAKPDIAVITKIGMSHIGLLGSLDEIAKAKEEIVEGLKDGGLLVLNYDDPFLRKFGEDQLSSDVRVTAVHSKPVSEETLSGKHANLICRNLKYDQNLAGFSLEYKKTDGESYLIKDLEVKIQGIHYLSNLLLALACLTELSYQAQEIKGLLKELDGDVFRQKILYCGPLTVIDDSYNAAPDSMRAALKNLASYPGEKKKIAVLGGMLELGDYEAEEHIKIGRLCVQYDINAVYAFSDKAFYYKKGAQTEGAAESYVKTFESREELARTLSEDLYGDEIILVKGSRSYKMEEIVARICPQDKNTSYTPEKES